MNDDETFLDRLNRVTNSFMEAKLVLAGVTLGLFERLAKGPATVAQLTADLEVTARGIEILADALVAQGYLGKDGGSYENSDGANRYLVPGGPDSQAFITGHRNQMFHTWAVLEDTIRHGQQVDESVKSTLTDRVSNRNFILGMAEVSRGRLGPILDKLPLDEARRFVDIGGGPAQYACEAARRHSTLEAVVVDLELTVEVAREQIAEQELTDRVSAVVCDFYREPTIELPGPADVALISQVFHAEGPEENLALLKKTHAIIREGGCLAIVENLVNPDRTSPVPAAMFAVNMLAGTMRGRTYTKDEIYGWLEEAGFAPQSTERLDPRTWLMLSRRR